MATGLRINYPQHYDGHQSLNGFPQPQQSIPAIPSSSSVSGTPNGNDGYAPLFQRFSHSDYNELQNCHALIESLQQRIHHLERINLNLEHRLEKEAKSNIELEKECIVVETNWSTKCNQLQSEIDTLKQNCETERMKNERLREHLSRTERELYSILQRKYELMRGGGGGKPSGPDPSRNIRSGLQTWESSILKNSESTVIEDMYGTQQVSCLHSPFAYV
jgi:glycerol-3-phosphate cytidylyltransferase-like family protein